MQIDDDDDDDDVDPSHRFENCFVDTLNAHNLTHPLVVGTPNFFTHIHTYINKKIYSPHIKRKKRTKAAAVTAAAAEELEEEKQKQKRNNHK